MKKNILFLLIDCLRSDVMYGEKGHARTDTLSYLKSIGTSFRNVISVASNTSPAVASMWTGLNPYAHGIKSLWGYKLHPDCVTLAELLKENGYRTCALVTGPLTEELGLNRGFDIYKWRPADEHLYNGFGDELANFIGEYSSGGPSFLYVHFYELHVPRQVTALFQANQYGGSPYERSLSNLDWYIGRLIEKINLEDTIIVVHADHGEKYRSSFWENLTRRYKEPLLKIGSRLGPDSRLSRFFWMGHGYHCYEFLIKVPLILVGKGIFPQGKHISTTVGQSDIMPTLLEAIGLKKQVPENIDGMSLMPIIKGDGFPERNFYVQACDPEIPESEWITGIRTPKWKYLMPQCEGKRKPVLFDIEKDPAETRNVIKENPRVAIELKNELLGMMAAGARNYSPESIQMSDEEKHKVGDLLKGLGYL